MENEMDVLGWWKINKFPNPKLAKLARSVLCLPASSSNSERVFSAAGRTAAQSVQDCAETICSGFNNFPPQKHVAWVSKGFSNYN